MKCLLKWKTFYVLRGQTDYNISILFDVMKHIRLIRNYFNVRDIWLSVEFKLVVFENKLFMKI